MCIRDRFAGDEDVFDAVGTEAQQDGLAVVGHADSGRSRRQVGQSGQKTQQRNRRVVGAADTQPPLAVFAHDADVADTQGADEVVLQTAHAFQPLSLIHI